MPKAEKGTPKDIANRSKARGLQKLKFYCQICSKQCRDENGFKCHLTAPSHLRNMTSFCHNATSILDDYSADFEKAYLDTLYRRHRTKRCNANNVYQEVIADRDHVHMNATKWSSLGDFVQYLGKVKKCVVEETERGWYVTFVERDAELLARQENWTKRVEEERAEEGRVERRRKKQRVEAAKLMDQAGVGMSVEGGILERDEAGDSVAVTLTIGDGNGNSLKSKKKKKGPSTKKSVFDDDDEDSDGHKGDDGENDDTNYNNLNDNSTQASSSNHEPLSRDSLGRKRNRWGSSKGPTPPVSTSTETKDERGSATRHSNERIIPDRNGHSYDKDGDNDRRLTKKRDDTKKTDQKRNNDDETVRRKKRWICPDILVQIASKKSPYYRRKGIVNRLLPSSTDDRYMAEVEILDSSRNARDGGDVLPFRQVDLETVIPKEGKEVVVVNGRGRGERAVLVKVEERKYRGTLELVGSGGGVLLKKVDFEDFSKAA